MNENLRQAEEKIQQLENALKQQRADTVNLIKEINVLRQALRPFVIFAQSDTGRKPTSAASTYPVPGLLYADFLQAKKALKK